MDFEIKRRIMLLKHIAPHQTAFEREKMWEEILQPLLSSWSRYPSPHDHGFREVFDALIPDLSDAQRARIPREIWESRFTEDYHYRLPWKHLPSDLFPLAWERLHNIREDDRPNLLENFVRYAPDHMIPQIEPEIKKLADNPYNGPEYLTRIQAMLIRRNRRLSKAERDASYLNLVRQHIKVYRLIDLLEYIPQDLMLQVLVMVLADYRDYRLNHKPEGPYDSLEVAKLLIDQMPVEDVSEAIRHLLDEANQDYTPYKNDFNPETTSKLCGALLSRLSEEERNRIRKAFVEKAEVEGKQELEHQNEREFTGVKLSLFGYLIPLLDSALQGDYWQRFFELTHSIVNSTRRTLQIVAHLEHYPPHLRLSKWQEAWQVLKSNQELDSSYRYWGLESVVAGIPVVFEEMPLKDKALAIELARAVAKLERPLTYHDRFSNGWIGLAHIVLTLDQNHAQTLFATYSSRSSMNPILACAFVPFLTPEQIDTLLIYKKEGISGIMTWLDAEFRNSLTLVIAQWSGSTATLVWTRSLDSIERFISDRPESYHPDFFMAWLRLIATAVPNYDVVAAWRHLLDHREVFWFSAWHELGAILIDHLQPVSEDDVSDEEAIRTIYRDIQGLGEGTATLQSAIAPKLPPDLIQSQRIQLADAVLPAVDVFTCSMPTYIHYGGTEIKQRLDFERRRRHDNVESNDMSVFSTTLLYVLGVANTVGYPFVYLWKLIHPVGAPIFRVIGIILAVLLYPVWFLWSQLERLSPHIARIVSIPFWLLRGIPKSIGALMEPVASIVNVHRLRRLEADKRLEKLVAQGSLAEFAAARPLLQRIGGRKLRYVADKAYRDAVKWWGDAVIGKYKASVEKEGDGWS